MSSSSPPPPPPSSLSADRSAFNLLRARAPSIAEQIEKASVQASPDDSSIADLYKIRWKNRRFVLESQLSRKTSRGRRSWISAHGDYLAELKEDDTVKAFSWSCTKCDANGRPQIFNAQSTSARLPQLSDAGDELERYYRLERVTVDNPIQWWVDHKGSFPQLSRLALDILAIPPMSTDCERAFSIAKLTFTSQRHTLQEATVQMLQLLKNWFRHCGIKIGGVAGGS